MSSSIISPLLLSSSDFTGINIATFFGAASNTLSAPFRSNSNNGLPYSFGINGISQTTIGGVPLVTYGLIAVTTFILGFVIVSENSELINGVTSQISDAASSVSNNISSSVSSIGDNFNSIGQGPSAGPSAGPSTGPSAESPSYEEQNHMGGKRKTKHCKIKNKRHTRNK